MENSDKIFCEYQNSETWGKVEKFWKANLVEYDKLENREKFVINQKRLMGKFKKIKKFRTLIIGNQDKTELKMSKSP